VPGARRPGRTCDRCYQRIRERNWKQDAEAFSTLLSDAISYLRERQDHLQSRSYLGGYSRYDWNEETGQLIFSQHGLARGVADIQFVGSISTRSDTWLWSWANKVDPAIGQGTCPQGPGVRRRTSIPEAGVRLLDGRGG
jgi:hypothetical protein